MSQGALYRKYRSKTFDEVIGQEHITTTLQNSIKNGTFSHAYLLTGPRGVGKTSIARLFACRVNDVKYEPDKTYGDIIEIDAASNRRIDEIRELREKVNIAPSALKYKVYIIDEVHMLTREAFNALLKTLEEPPSHVIFILATTDFHKVPDTIVSRCVRFSFLSIPPSDIKKHLQKIAKQESIKIEDEALDIIADNSDGSFRDAISLLDQFRNSSGTIKADYIAAILGIGPAKEIAALASHIEASDPKKIIESLDKLRSNGSSDSQIVKQLMGYFRDCLLGQRKSALSKPEIVDLIENLIKTSDYPDTHLALEIALVGFRSEQAATRPLSPQKPVEKTPQKPEADEPKKPDIQETVVRTSAIAVDNPDFWQTVLDVLKNENNTLYSLARMAEARINDKSLELHFKFPFHYKQMNMEKNYLQIEKTIKSIDSKIVSVNLYVIEGERQGSDQQPQSDPLGPSKEPVKNISNIFGPSEVLES